MPYSLIDLLTDQNAIDTLTNENAAGVIMSSYGSAALKNGNVASILKDQSGSEALKDRNVTDVLKNSISSAALKNQYVFGLLKNEDFANIKNLNVIEALLDKDEIRKIYPQDHGKITDALETILYGKVIDERQERTLSECTNDQNFAKNPKFIQPCKIAARKMRR